LVLPGVEYQESEVQLTYLEGRWHDDEVNVTATLVAPGIPTTIRSERNEAGEETATVIGEHSETCAPITFSLRRGTVGYFEALCKAGAS
jgi:hypothetical protein